VLEIRTVPQSANPPVAFEGTFFGNMPYLKLNHTDIWYEDTGGDNTPVVFLHASSGTTKAWENQLPAFVQAGYRCITYDRRGWGKSRDTSVDVQTTYAVDDLQSLVSHLGFSCLHLVSTAAGGSVALDYALTNPGLLRSLVISHWGGGTMRMDPDFARELSRYERLPGFESLPAWFRELGPTYRAANPEGVARWMKIEAASQHTTSNGETMRNKFSLGLLGNIKIPTMMISSHADLYAASPSVRIMASRIPNSEFTVLCEGGHAAHWETPEAWNQVVLDFIARH